MMTTLPLVLSLLCIAFCPSAENLIGNSILPLMIRSILPVELSTIQHDLEAYRQRNHPETTVAFWAESSIYGSVFSNEDEIRPAASTIKVFILIAAYLEYRDVWNEVPDELPPILRSEPGYQEPLGMLSTTAREDVRNTLWSMTYRELSESMMGINQNSLGNDAYNAACNVLVFLLGGDTGGCTEKIQAIHSEFSSVRIGRYMLETRTADNDNECSMRSLAAACRMVCTRSIPDLTPDEQQEIVDCFQNSSFHGLDCYQKHGHLFSSPSVNAWVGWFEAEGEYFLYGVNVLHPDCTSDADEGADHYCDLLKDRLYLLSALQQNCLNAH
jgi:hypothetical protein